MTDLERIATYYDAEQIRVLADVGESKYNEELASELSDDPPDLSWLKHPWVNESSYTPDGELEPRPAAFFK